MLLFAFVVMIGTGQGEGWEAARRAGGVRLRARAAGRDPQTGEGGEGGCASHRDREEALRRCQGAPTARGDRQRARRQSQRCAGLCVGGWVCVVWVCGCGCGCGWVLCVGAVGVGVGVWVWVDGCVWVCVGMLSVFFLCFLCVCACVCVFMCVSRVFSRCSYCENILKYTYIQPW
jgi:hypothetical protein